MLNNKQTNKQTNRAFFFKRTPDLLVSRETTPRHIPHIRHHFPPVILANSTVVAFILISNSLFSFHCCIQREPVPTQKSSRKWELRPFATSCTKNDKGYSFVQTSFAELPDSLAFILLSNSLFSFHCYTRREPVPTQKSSRKWELRPFATSCTKDYKGHSLVQTSFAELPDRPICSIHSLTGLLPGRLLLLLTQRISLCEKSLSVSSATGKQLSFLKENVLILT